MLTLLVALAVLIAGVAPAHAGFLVPLIAGAAFAATTAGVIITAAANVALAVGLSFVANRLLRPKAPSHQPQEQPAGGVELDVRLDADVPQSIIFGRAVTAGSRIYAETFSAPLEVPGPLQGVNLNNNRNMIEIIALADHPCEGLVATIVEGQEVGLTDHGTDLGFTVDEYENAGNQPLLATRFFNGTQTGADSYTIERLSGHPERPWNSDMVGHGRTYARNWYQYDQELVPSLLRWRYVVDGIRLYDPRKDSTVGGSGSHRFGDLDTHEFTQNLIVIAYNILRGIRVADHADVPRHFYGLENTPAANLPLDVWFAAMNEADLTVDGEPQFHGGAEIGVDTEPLEVVREILKACDGRLVEIGGVYKVYVGPPGLPVFSFNDSHIRVDSEEAFKPIRPLIERINHVAGKFTSPEDGWIPKVAPARVDADSEAADGRRVTGELDAPWVQSGKHIQRLQKQMLFRARKERRHTLPLPPEMYGLEPGDIVEWTSQRNGYIDKLFEVVAVQDHHDLTSTAEILELDEDDYDWEPGTDLIPFPDGSLVQGRPAPRTLNDFAATGAVHIGSTGVRPAILLTWTPPDDDDITGVAWQLRTAALPSDSTSGRMEEPEAGQLVILGGLVSLTEYEVRARFTSFNGYATEWTLWIAVRTPDARLGFADLDRFMDARLTQLDIASEAAIARALARQSETVSRLSHHVMGLWARLEDQDQIQLTQSGVQTTRALEEVATEREVRATEVSQIKGRLDDPETGLIATFNNIQVVEGRVTITEGTIEVHSSQIIGLTSAIEDPETGLQANANALQSLETTVTVQGNTITVNSSAITDLESTVDNPSTGVVATATALGALETLVTVDQQGQITSQANRITSLESTVNNPNTGVIATATAVDSITTLVQHGAHGNLALASRATTLEATVNHPSTGVASKASITRVDTVEAKHDALAVSFNQVFASTASGQASAMVRFAAQSAPAGVAARIALQAKTQGGSFGGASAAAYLDVVSGLSRITLVADRIRFASSDSAGATIRPFAQFTGGLIHLHSDVRIDGNLVVVGTLHANKIVSNSIPTDKIAPGAVTDVNAATFTPGGSDGLTLNNPTGSRALLFGTFPITGNAGTATISIVRGPVIVLQFQFAHGGGASSVSVSALDLSPPSGSSTYLVGIIGAAGPNGNGNLVGLILKR